MPHSIFHVSKGKKGKNKKSALETIIVSDYAMVVAVPVRGRPIKELATNNGQEFP